MDELTLLRSTRDRQREPSTESLTAGRAALLTRIAAYLFRRAGRRGLADWLSRRRILLRTAVARRVEMLIVTDLLDVPLDTAAADRDPSASARAWALASSEGRRRVARVLCATN